MNFVCAHNDFAVVGSESGVGQERHSEEGAYGSASGVSGCYEIYCTVVVSLSGKWSQFVWHRVSPVECCADRDLMNVKN